MTHDAENDLSSPPAPEVERTSELAVLGPQLNRAFWAGLVGLGAVFVTIIATVAISGNRVVATGFGFVVAELGLLAVVLLRLRRRALHQAVRLAAQQRELEAQSHQLEVRASALADEAARSRFLADYLRDTNQELRDSIDALSHARAEVHDAHRLREASDTALDVVLASAPFGIALLDLELRFERANAALTSFDGLAPADHKGRSAGEVIPPPLAAEIEPVLREVLESERPALGVHVEGETPAASGRARQWTLNVFPVHGSDGKIRGLGLIVVDTTERRQLERQLQHAQKMEAVGRLAGSIAHDFNNLLTAIAAFAQFAMEGLGSEHSSRDDIGQIILATERGSALTRRLLAFSRQQVLQPRAVDLNRLVVSLEGLLRRLLGEDINFRTRLAPDLPPIDVDPAQTEQVIVNLAINARDAMPRGGILMISTDTVELDAEYVRSHRDARTGPHVVLTISDTGVGMDPATQEHAFEPFFTTKPLGKGTGLGLSSVHGIVKQSGGSIWLYSERGRGTTFKVFFPQGTHSIEPGEGHEAAASPAGLGAVNVLVVEDDAAVRQAVHRVLVRNGCRVHDAENGVQAVELCEQLGGAVDLVVSDLIMPELGGLEFAKRIHDRWPKVRVLFMSGYAADSIERDGLRNAGATFIEKPFTAEALLAKVREAMDTRGAAGSAAA